MTLYVNSCSKCRFYLLEASCLAFDSIPTEIWTGENDHHKPYTGDHGIQFEPLDESEDDE